MSLLCEVLVPESKTLCIYERRLKSWFTYIPVACNDLPLQSLDLLDQHLHNQLQGPDAATESLVSGYDLRILHDLHIHPKNQSLQTHTQI